MLVGERLCAYPSMGGPNLLLVELEWIKVEVTNNGSHAGEPQNQVGGEAADQLIGELSGSGPCGAAWEAVDGGHQDLVMLDPMAGDL